MAPEYPYVWLLWSIAFLVPWALVYAMAPAFRPRMLRVSLATSLLGLTNVLCRPDLVRNTLLGGALFTGLYAIFMGLLIVAVPGYVEAVSNLAALSGWSAGAIPVEELAFGFGFGMYWAGIYEHFAWHRGHSVAHRQA